MGRHAKGAARLRVSVSTVVLGTLIVTVVAVGSLLSSYAQPTPIAAEGVNGTAVVVSSLACQDGSGGSQVDVLNPKGLPAGVTVRATLDACGYQEGEQLAVQYLASDPTQVTLLGDSVGDTATGGRLLPYGLVLAALLAAGAAAAVWLDARRGRRTRALATHHDHEAPVAGVVDAELPVASHPEPEPPIAAKHAAAAPDSAELKSAAPHSAASGRHARAEIDPYETTWLPALPSLPPPPWPSADADAAADDAAELADWDLLVDRRLSSVDLSFPFTASLADSLHDELFTHRSVSS